MRTTLRKFGNSQAVIIPKPVLAQVGLPGEVDLTVQYGVIVLRPVAANPRHGWAKASRDIAAAGDDKPVWPGFANEGDAGLKW